jgi:hypothetical protein
LTRRGAYLPDLVSQATARRQLLDSLRVMHSGATATGRTRPGWPADMGSGVRSRLVRLRPLTSRSGSPAGSPGPGLHNQLQRSISHVLRQLGQGRGAERASARSGIMRRATRPAVGCGSRARLGGIRQALDTHRRRRRRPAREDRRGGSGSTIRLRADARTVERYPNRACRVERAGAAADERVLRQPHAVLQRGAVLPMSRRRSPDGHRTRCLLLRG